MASLGDGAMTSFGCVVCYEQTSDSKERFIIPWTHEMFCEKHKPEGSIQLSEFYAYGGSWFNWEKVRKSLRQQKMGGAGVA